MSSPPGTPKRKGLRSLLPGSFSKSRSRSPSQSSQRPEPSALSSSAGHNEGAAPTSRTTPATSPTDGPATSSHLTTPSAIPRIVEPDDANTSQSRRRAAWTKLRTSLQVLNDNTGVFPPLSSAIGLLLTCLDGLEVTAGDRQEYEDLSKELARLSEFLHQRTQASGSYPISKSIINISKSIEQQVQEINVKLMKTGGGGIRQATIDEEDILRHYRRIESLFRQLQADVTMGTWSIANEHLSTTRLEGLKPVKQATYDSELSTEIDRRTCTEGTRIGVLGDLNEWHHDPSSASVYWMNGMAGTGKTTIACTFCEQLEERKLLAGSFFCTRSSAECRKVTRIVPTIAYQLARYSHPFKSVLCEVLDQDPDAGTKNLTKQFEKLLKEPLARVKDALPGDLVVVIDALDECDDRSGVEQVLDMLFRYAADVPLKFLVTSRPEPEIYQRMTQHAQSRVAIHLHDIEKSLVQADIKLYLEGELSSMLLSPPQIDELVNRSGALFIYAATLVRYIRSGERLGNSRKRLAIALGMTAESTKRHAQIDALYTAVLKSALSGEELEADEAEDVRAVLRTVLFAQEPISIDTIATLAEIDDPERVKSALQPLRSVLHQSEQTGLVSTLHASFPDFMFNNERSGSYFYDVVEHSQLMARRCFSVMKAQLRFNICNLSSSFVLDKDVADIEDRIRTHISATLAYTCRHWANHLQLAHSTECLLKILSEFLSDRFLFWMEVLNLKQEMNTGVEILVKVKHWLIQVDPSSELTYQIEDCRSFFTSYAANPISRSTPHIYISSLPLCPRTNSIYKHYWGSTRGLLELKGTLMESREGAALATWNMDSAVGPVAYSPDGTQVAVGCSSGSFSIRNTHDGSLLLGPFQIVGTKGSAADAALFIGPIFVSGSIASLSYSPDGTRVVTASVDGTIRVWSTRNGEILTGPFRGVALEVCSVAFSPDGTRIVSGSPHGSICFWNPDTGTPAIDRSSQSPERTNCVAFSPDGRYIAFGLHDGSIHFLHASDGTPALAPLEGHTSEIMSLAFSPGGTRLVSSSRDCTIRIWNPSSGTLTTGPLKGHTSDVSSVAISRDGKYVASGSHDTTVRVWNIDDGSPFAGPFSGHRGAIYSVAFSTDGTRLISGSDDGTIRVWNVSNSLLLPSPFGDHMSSIQTAIFSPDEQSIFSSSFQGIRIWSSDEGSLIANITRGRPYSRCFSTYSHDRTRHAIFLEDHSIQLLSTEDASTVAGPFKGHTDTVTCASFSRDNTRLVSGSKDRTVRVWEVESGQLAAGPFYGHAGDIALVTFSFQGTKVMSYANDKSIRVWNLVDCILDVDISSQASASPISSTIPSAFENWTIKEDGWVTNGGSSLLFWFPADLPSAPSPHTGLIITGSGALIITKQKLLVGDEWTKCYIP